MPGLVKKLLISAAVDGLFLQPANIRGTEGAIRIEYGTSNRIVPASTSTEAADTVLEVHGIVGFLNLVSSSYLVSITRRQQVAQIRDSPVFRITDVTLIPLKSKRDAQRAIDDAHKTLKEDAAKHAMDGSDDSDVGEDVETSTISSVDSIDKPSQPQKPEPKDEAAALEPPKSAVFQNSTSLVKDVVKEKGRYGRLASKWLSRDGPKESAKKQEGVSAEEGGNSTKVDDQKAQEEAGSVKPVKRQDAIEYLTPRILRSARLYFSSSGFYFSYDHNLSTSLAHSRRSENSSPLWKRFDPLFFWNQHLMDPMIGAGQDSFVLPLLQGFVGQRAFSIAQIEGSENDVVAETSRDQLNSIEMQSMSTSDHLETKGVAKHDFVLTLISRRSIKRAGLRYLRRGVDDDGNVANSVETEQILSSQNWSNSEKTFSLLQLRGSIPLFFSQSPYSFKPLPILFGSETTNQAAFKRHFTQIFNRYGNVQATSLVDAHGSEVAIGKAYEQQAKRLNESGGIEGKELGFEWFDFHSACKGMRFENVSILLDTLQSQLDSFGWFSMQNDDVTKQQNGILRTNCMDCLDRTNVVQSAVGGRALQEQLSEIGLTIDLKSDPKTQWFNTLWADNGDAISKQYAGTSALKGDFTRTRKRNWAGALSDFSLTLNRYYNNIFGDYFLQTNIDYFLGNASPAVFDEFETDMTTQDYALDMRHVRQNAIDTCVKIVLEDPKEIQIAGWTLSCPNKSDSFRTLPFEECVLLLTDTALYFCRFNWETEKIGSFERVDLLDIREMWRGSYITNALGGTHLDESKNVGFAVRYRLKELSPVRVNTRSLSVAEGLEKASDDTEKSRKKNKESKTTTSKESSRMLAFKTLPPKAVASKQDNEDLTTMSELDSMKNITGEISKAMTKAWSRDDSAQSPPPTFEEKDVISVADAKRTTGYLESVGYSLKKMVWS